MTRRRPQQFPGADAGRPEPQLSRRGVLRGAGAVGLGALLAACGTTPGSETGSGMASPGKDRSDSDPVVNWASRRTYLDYDPQTKTYPTLTKFEAQTGIKVNYSEEIEDNASYYARIRGQLAAGQDFGRDLIVLTDYMAARMIRQGWAQRLDKAVIPNADNLTPPLQKVDFDPDRSYSLPWQSGYAGLAWNKREVPGGLRQVSDLWKPELRGRVEVLTEFRDTCGLIMLEQGVDIGQTFTANQFGQALDVLQTQLNDGQIRQVKGNSYKDDLISGDAKACIAWSGDITQLNAQNGDNWEFRIPESGGTLWSDNLLIPIGSQHKKNAEILMNYYYDPMVAATVEESITYVCPVQGAQQAMAKLNPDLEYDDLVFPSEDFLKTVHVFRELSPAEESEYELDYRKVMGL